MMRSCKHRRCDNLDLRGGHNCCCCRMGGSAWTCLLCGHGECHCCGKAIYYPRENLNMVDNTILAYCPTPDKPNHAKEGMYCAAQPIGFPAQVGVVSAECILRHRRG